MEPDERCEYIREASSICWRHRCKNPSKFLIRGNEPAPESPLSPTKVCGIHEKVILRRSPKAFSTEIESE